MYFYYPDKVLHWTFIQYLISVYVVLLLLYPAVNFYKLSSHWIQYQDCSSTR